MSGSEECAALELSEAHFPVFYCHKIYLQRIQKYKSMIINDQSKKTSGTAIIQNHNESEARGKKQEHQFRLSSIL